MSTTESVTISVYKNEVERYLNEVERNSNQEDVAGVQHLRAAVNLMTLKTFDISPSQKLLIAELAVQNNFGNSIKTRIVFNLFGERIFRCRIFVFKDSFTGYDDEKAIHIMLHEGDRKQLQYTGQVDIYSTSKKLELRGTLQNGKLIKVAVATIIKNKIKNTARSNGCIDYYLVTSQGNTVVSVVFLYTLCEANTGDFVGGGGGGGGDGSYSLGSYLVLPVNPQQNAVHTHKDIDGTTITYKFIDNIWKIVQVVLPDLVLKSGRESNYGFLNFEFPEHDQMVMGYDGLSYRYNSFTGNWTGNEVVLVKDPCSEINALLDYNSIETNSLKGGISWLKNKVNAPVNNKEAGVEVKKVMNPDETFKYEFTQVLSQEQFSIPLSIGSSYVGGLHSHPSDGYAMFSFQDIRFLLSVYDEASSTRKEEAFIGLVAKDAAGNTNTYMLKIENIESLRTQINNVWTSEKYSKFQNEDDRIKAIHLDQAIKYSKSKENLEKSFLDQFKDFGIVLFKADATTDHFDKLTLNNSTVTPTPCN